VLSRRGGTPTEGARAAGPTFASEPVVRPVWGWNLTIGRPGDPWADVFGHALADRAEWLRPFFRVVPRGSEVLDLGCGCGVSDARLLSESFRVTGVDISDVRAGRARGRFRHARFIRANLTEVDFRPETFDGALCLYALVHVPPEKQPPLLARLHRWLRPGGILLIVMGSRAYPRVAANGVGTNAQVYGSSADADTYQSWLESTGFEVLRRSRVSEDGRGHALFLARKRPEPFRANASLPGLPGATHAGRERPVGARRISG